jgi:preprotein translocase subunit SecA
MRKEGRSVVVVATTASGYDGALGALEGLAPTGVQDRFGLAVLRQRLDQPGAVTVATGEVVREASVAGGAAPSAGGSAAATPVGVLVLGRHDRREADDAVVAFFAPCGKRAHVTFHVAFDDPLLRDLGPRIKEMLDRMGLSEDEPVVHALVSAAIVRAQRKT